MQGTQWAQGAASQEGNREFREPGSCTVGCEIASPLFRREILSLSSKVVHYTNMPDKIVWRQLVPPVTVCAET